MMTAADVMTRQVITVAPETPVHEIAALLHGQRISGVPVVSDGRVVGMVSEGDLMSHVGAVGEPPRRRSWWLSLFSDNTALAERYAKTHGRAARDVMSTDVITAREDQPLAEIARLLGKHGIKRVPVLREGRLVGIVSRANLLQALATAAPRMEVSADDRAIGQAIATELADKPWATYVSVIVRDGVAHLSGFIENEAERRAVRLAAENAPGVKGIEDDLSRRPAYQGE